MEKSNDILAEVTRVMKLVIYVTAITIGFLIVILLKREVYTPLTPIKVVENAYQTQIKRLESDLKAATMKKDMNAAIIEALENQHRVTMNAVVDLSKLHDVP